MAYGASIIKEVKEELKNGSKTGKNRRLLFWSEACGG